MNHALLGLTAPRRLTTRHPQGTAPELKLAAACFITLLLLLTVWLGKGGTGGKMLQPRHHRRGGIPLPPLCPWQNRPRLHQNPARGHPRQRLARPAAARRHPDRRTKNRAGRSTARLAHHPPPVRCPGRPTLAIRPTTLAGAAQPARLAASRRRTSVAVHQPLHQPQRDAHLGVCLRTARRGAGQPRLPATAVVRGFTD